eukprot:587498-Rhodomonas_salina.1
MVYKVESLGCRLWAVVGCRRPKKGRTDSAWVTAQTANNETHPGGSEPGKMCSLASLLRRKASLPALLACVKNDPVRVVWRGLRQGPTCNQPEPLLFLVCRWQGAVKP